MKSISASTPLRCDRFHMIKIVGDLSYTDRHFASMLNASLTKPNT